MTDRDPKHSVPADQELRAALLKLVPQLLWFLLAAMIALAVTRPVLRALDSGQGLELSAASVTIKIVERRLGRAAQGENAVSQEVAIGGVVSDRIRRSRRQLSGAVVLWVDDHHPTQNAYERRALSALGVAIDAVRTTEEAISLLRGAASREALAYDAIITDLDRDGQRAAQCFVGSRYRNAGCATLQSARELCGETMPPAIIYVSGFRPEYGTPAYALGVTNRVDELIMLLLDAFERRPQSQDIDAFVEQDDREPGDNAPRACARSRLPDLKDDPSDDREANTAKPEDV